MLRGFFLQENLGPSCRTHSFALLLEMVVGTGGLKSPGMLGRWDSSSARHRNLLTRSRPGEAFSVDLEFVVAEICDETCAGEILRVHMTLARLKCGDRA